MPTTINIFGIGLSRTGTLSLTEALTILGYKAIHYPINIFSIENNVLKISNNEIIENNDAFTDIPITLFYKQLDNDYPNSKFILTIRDIDPWLQSCKKFFSFKKQNIFHNLLKIQVYGTVIYNQDKFISAYRNHLNDVLTYFKNRPEDLLIINICNGEGWEKLCNFVNKPIPHVPFPRKNVTSKRWLVKRQLVRILKATSIYPVWKSFKQWLHRK